MTGLNLLVRSFLRRDRWMILWFVVGITLLYWSQGYSVDGIYQSQKAFDAAAAMMERNAAFIAMTGPPRALNTTGGQVAWQSQAFGAILAGLMSMLLVGRHTRAEEESGRDELLRAGVVGRHAPMTAALVVVLVANAAVGVAVTLSLVAYGLAAAGAVALGAGLAGVGLAFGVVGLLAVQLTASTRAAYGLTGAVIGVAYALRAVGDVSGGPWSWLSPIGWYQAMHAYSGERWWPLLLLAGFTVAAGLAAHVVFDRRDFGSGLWAARPGPERASAQLGSGLGLAWRLQRGSSAGWVLGMLLLGLTFGTFGDDVDTLVGDSEVTRAMYGGGAEVTLDSFYAASCAMLAVIAAGYTISSALRPRAEEEQGRLETLLSTALPRRRWLIGHAAITVTGTLLVLAATGVGLGAGYGLVSGDWERFPSLLGACLVLVPGVLVLGAVAWLLHGWIPRSATLSWFGLVLCAVVMFFGELLDLPRWVVDLSPLSHLGSYPAGAVEWSGFAWLLVVAVVAFLTAVHGFTRRDVA